MPLITVSLYPGRSEEQKRLFAEKITNLAVEILNTKPEHVIVVFDENQKENWYLAGENLWIILNDLLPFFFSLKNS